MLAHLFNIFVYFLLFHQNYFCYFWMRKLWVEWTHSFVFLHYKFPVGILCFFDNFHLLNETFMRHCLSVAIIILMNNPSPHVVGKLKPMQDFRAKRFLKNCILDSGSNSDPPKLKVETFRLGSPDPMENFTKEKKNSQIFPFLRSPAIFIHNKY